MDGKIYTPPVGNSILTGITRGFAITLAEEKGYPVIEQQIPGRSAGRHVGHEPGLGDRPALQATHPGSGQAQRCMGAEHPGVAEVEPAGDLETPREARRQHEGEKGAAAEGEQPRPFAFDEPGQRLAEGSLPGEPFSDEGQARHVRPAPGRRRDVNG